MWTDKTHRHLTDQDLLDRYLAERDGEGALEPRHDHAAGCSPCAERYSELTRDLNLFIDADTADAELVFTPERLAQQRQHIMRRLESRGRGADIFQFPRRGSRTVTLRTSSQRSTRWVAAAAAAGLAVGLGLGLSVERLTVERSPGLVAQPAQPAQPEMMTARTEQTQPPAPTGSVDTSFVRSAPPEDELLAEIDAALVSHRVGELTALDALTPEPISISLRRR